MAGARPGDPGLPGSVRPPPPPQLRELRVLPLLHPWRSPVQAVRCSWWTRWARRPVWAATRGGGPGLPPVAQSARTAPAPRCLCSRPRAVRTRLAPHQPPVSPPSPCHHVLKLLSCHTIRCVLLGVVGGGRRVSGGKGVDVTETKRGKSSEGECVSARWWQLVPAKEYRLNVCASVHPRARVFSKHCSRLFRKTRKRSKRTISS